MINETGEFVDDENDGDEILEIRQRGTSRISRLDDLKGMPIPELAMPCLECKGAKLMSYKIIKIHQPPWILRILGFWPLRTERDENGVPCRRCKGTGIEKLSTSGGVDKDAAAA